MNSSYQVVVSPHGITQAPVRPTAAVAFGRNMPMQQPAVGLTGTAVAGIGASLEHVRQGLLTLHTILSTMQDPTIVVDLARSNIREGMLTVDSVEPNVCLLTSSAFAGTARNQLQESLDDDRPSLVTSQTSIPQAASEGMIDSTISNRQTPNEDALEAAVAVAAARLRLRRTLATVATSQTSMLVPARSPRRRRFRDRQRANPQANAGHETAYCRSPTFFAGQWLDVEDTVHQWLEATVMRVRSRRMLVHYNGWPTRWDEWIDFDSNRLAPFRTRTLHSSNSPHASPSPVAHIDDAPVTSWARERRSRSAAARATAPPDGRARFPSLATEAAQRRVAEDVRVAVVETQRIFNRVAPLLEALAEMSRDDLSRRDAEAVAILTSASDPNLPWAWPAIQSDGSDTTRGDMPVLTERDGRRTIEISNLARDAAPLLDRLGRVLSDLSPHVAALARDRHTPHVSTSTEEAIDPPLAAARLRGRSYEIDGAHEDGDGMTTNSPAQVEPTLPTDNLLGVVGPERAPLSHSDPYRALVATPSRVPHLHPPGSSPGNIDIHIHAILTPLRNQANIIPADEGVNAPPSSTNTPSRQSQSQSQGAIFEAVSPSPLLSVDQNYQEATQEACIDDTSLCPLDEQNTSSWIAQHEAPETVPLQINEIRTLYTEYAAEYYEFAMAYLNAAVRYCL